MAPTPYPPLSKRECEVLQWILDGKTDGEIALILGISPKTINFHVENAKRKLGVSHRVRAIAIGLKTGMLTLTMTDAQDDDDGRRARPRTPDCGHAHVC